MLRRRQRSALPALVGRHKLDHPHRGSLTTAQLGHTAVGMSGWRTPPGELGPVRHFKRPTALQRVGRSYNVRRPSRVAGQQDIEHGNAGSWQDREVNFALAVVEVAPSGDDDVC
jgi:hypothetical protein